MNEKQLENLIFQYLKYREGFFFKINTIGVYDKDKGIYRKNINPNIITGTSDILGVVRGRFIAMEVKTKQNKKRPKEQIDFIDMVNKNGGLADFITSINDVERLLNE